jgi:hypothetical protein
MIIVTRQASSSFKFNVTWCCCHITPVCHLTHQAGHCYIVTRQAATCVTGSLLLQHVLLAACYWLQVTHSVTTYTDPREPLGLISKHHLHLQEKTLAPWRRQQEAFSISSIFFAKFEPVGFVGFSIKFFDDSHINKWF